MSTIESLANGAVIAWDDPGAGPLILLAAERKVPQREAAAYFQISITSYRYRLAMLRRGPNPRSSSNETVPDDAILTRFVGKGWALSDLTTLCELWIGGHSSAEIGRRIHKSKNAIIGKCHRMRDFGLVAPRDSPIIRDRPAPVKSRALGLAPSLPPLPSGIVPMPRKPPAFNFIRAATVHRAAPPPRPVVVPREVAPRIMSGKCQFPLWGDHERPTHKFCDAPAPVGESWCDACRKVVFARVSRTEIAA